MDPADLENSVKRIIGEEIKKSQNDLLTQMDGLFSAKLKNFDNQQEGSESQMSRLQSELSSSDEYKFQRKLTVALKEADLHLEPRDASAALAKQTFFEGMELLRYR